MVVPLALIAHTSAIHRPLASNQIKNSTRNAWNHTTLNPSTHRHHLSPSSHTLIKGLYFFVVKSVSNPSPPATPASTPLQLHESRTIQHQYHSSSRQHRTQEDSGGEEQEGRKENKLTTRPLPTRTSLPRLGQGILRRGAGARAFSCWSLI